ncbi:PREDICTED: mitochondrial enolase superfamily member 1-like [Vollenhovia emeryi]|uniref:mitochondrial enolase superfamily member 1-like n=1 Tax=Vollenhovia emeryi TaxID=411798 RepID=UPI0005F4808B|nr:PREDICTED: mitochondrial enolase superfamily member 1-like [Vollenhovia emeryi]
MLKAKIIAVDVKDIRFPTSVNHDGSDAMHTDPDYSCVYVTIRTSRGQEGYGLTFTLGRGTEIVAQACKSLATIVLYRRLEWIYDEFGTFWRRLTSDSQLRWVGPEKGVIHLATAAIINALWDLWARIEGKPVWQLLSDMKPEQLVSVIDFRYIQDIVTEATAIQILEEKMAFRDEQKRKLLENGYPAYNTQVGWLGYSDEQLKDLCKKFLGLGYTAFKIKVGRNLEDDIRRCKVIRKVIGYTNKLMLDANQVWDVNDAIEWMKQLATFKPIWIEEPTSPDDVFGHAQILNALQPYGIGVASGEMCANRVMFKQFLRYHAINYCQVDSARIGGINEILAVYFMAYLTKIPVCPHAGGIGLCEMVQHLQMWDYICLSQTSEDRMIEFVDQQHEHFEDPVCIKNACYMPTMKPGYSTKLKEKSIAQYAYPDGDQWKITEINKDEEGDD